MPIKSKKKTAPEPVVTFHDGFRTYLAEAMAAFDADGTILEPTAENIPAVATIEAAVIVTAADGEMDDAEWDKIYALLYDLVEGDFEEGVIGSLVGTLQRRIAEVGADVRAAAIAESLDEAWRERAFRFACVVSALSAGDESSDDAENEALTILADAFGFSEDQASEIYAAVEEQWAPADDEDAEEEEEEAELSAAAHRPARARSRRAPARR